jgi:hypothetical protein
MPISEDRHERYVRALTNLWEWQGRTVAVVTTNTDADPIADLRGVRVEKVEALSEGERPVAGEAIKVGLSLSETPVADFTVHEGLLDDLIEGGRELTVCQDGVVISLWDQDH